MTRNDIPAPALPLSPSATTGLEVFAAPAELAETHLLKQLLELFCIDEDGHLTYMYELGLTVSYLTSDILEKQLIAIRGTHNNCV